jgi:hypothetical protein
VSAATAVHEFSAIDEEKTTKCRTEHFWQVIEAGNVESGQLMTGTACVHRRSAVLSTSPCVVVRNDCFNSYLTCSLAVGKRTTPLYGACKTPTAIISGEFRKFHCALIRVLKNDGL